MWNRFILGLTGLGGIVCGAVFFTGPDTISEEIPYHREVGLAMAGFGALFLIVVLFPRTGFGRRAKYLLFSLAAGTLAVLAGLGFVPDVLDSLKLAEEGEPATAIVVRRVMRMTRSARTGTSTSYASEVEYAGHRGVIDGSRAVGTGVPVLYLPSDPSVVRAGRAGDGFLDLAAGDGAGFWIRGGLMLLMGILALACLPRVFFGAPPDDEDPFDA